MDEEIIIVYLNNEEKITKFNSESNKRFNERIQFIRKLEQHKLKWKDANKLGKIWYNIKYKNMKYMPQIYKQYLFYIKE
jgi:hypothetical protein